MGFLDKAKAAANDLATKADSALSGAGSGGGGARPADAERYFRDLGVLTYLESTGRPVDAADRERVMAGLQELDAAGSIRSFALQTTPPPAPGQAGSVPPPPGAAASAPPPPGAATSAPPPPPPGAAPAPPPPPGAAPAPPPPPSWANNDDSRPST